MKKYNIEGDIDFFSELYKSLDNEENNCKTEEDDNLCLITNQPLIDKFVKMNCEHKFNYLPLFNDLVNHKKKFNNMEGTSTHLKMNEIRCPYCRKKSTGLLPYYEELGLAKITGVNYIDTNYNPDNDLDAFYNKCYNHCEFLAPNVYFNPKSQNIIEFYKPNLNVEDCKFIKCKHMGTQINSHYSNFDIGITDEKYYCWNHKKLVINKYKKDKSDKAKEEAKLLKEKSKQLKKETKEKEKEEKQKIKEELKKTVQLAKMNKYAKTPNNNHENDNVVIGISDVIIEEHIVLCVEIIKSGPKKNLQCCLKIYKNNLCKRHYNLNNKNIVNI
jgi:hypothetical protein